MADSNTPITLPETFSQLEHEYPSLWHNSKSYLKANFDNVGNTVENTVYKYSLRSSQQTRRPAGSAIVFTVGPDGSGKSATLNNFLRQPIFSLGKFESGGSLAEYSCVEFPVKDQAWINGQLYVVDTPGVFFDSNGNIPSYLDVLERAREHFDLSSRRCVYNMEQCVYPNIILLVLSATDNRIANKNSMFAKTLDALEKCNLIDHERNNLVIVLTHVTSLSSKADEVADKILEITKVIKKLVWQKVQIFDVDVVSIENNPYSGTPNLDELRSVMVRVAKSSGDLLGELLISNYNRVPGELQLGELCKLTFMKHSDAIIWGSLQFTLGFQRKFCLKQLGFGYCPKTETVFNTIFDQSWIQKRTKRFGETEFFVADFVAAEYNVRAEVPTFTRTTCFSKEQYEEQLRVQHQLDSDVKLQVNIERAGNWMEVNQQNLIRFVLELEMCRIFVASPNQTTIHHDIQKELDNLPQEYSTEAKNMYENFFKKVGTHVITEQTLGGKYVVYIPIKHDSKGNLQEEYFSESYKQRVQDIVKDAFNSGNSLKLTLKDKDSPFHGTIMTESSSGISKPLEAWDPEELQQQMKIICTDPKETGTITKIEPLYDLLPEGNRYTSLRQATIAYLSGCDSFPTKITSLEESEYFPLITLVQLPTGESLQMGNIESGKAVTVMGQDWSTAWNSMATNSCTFETKPFGHYECTQLSFSHGKMFAASPKTTVWKLGKTNKPVSMEIRRIKVGDFVCCKSGTAIQWQDVLSKSHVWIDRVVCPVFNTPPGNLIVNGVFVSVSHRPKGFFGWFG